MRYSGGVIALGLLLGCGYTQEPIVQERYQRLAIPVFDNDTFYRELEFALTDEVIRQAQARPDIRVVPVDEARVVLRGRITELRQSVISEDDSDRVRESSAMTTVDVELHDRQSGQVLERYTVRDRADFTVTRGESLITAQAESFLDLARLVVNGLERGFEGPGTDSGPDDGP